LTTKLTLQVLVVCDNHHDADQLVHEIGELFDRFDPVVCAQHEASGMVLEGCYDLAIINAENSGKAVVELVQSIRSLTTELPIIVSLPQESDIFTHELSLFGRVYCLTQNNRDPKTVTTIIEEVLRKPVAGSANWIGNETASIETQAEMMRTAAGTLSHEINNPLMAIMGISELILNDRKNHNPDIAHKITMIRKSAERIESSLKRLSEISESSLKTTPAGDIIDINPNKQARKNAKLVKI
jgi:signal transduction histidine kinase